MPAKLWVGDCVIVRGTYKCYIECPKKDNYVTVWFIFEIHTEIVQHNQFFQAPIVEGSESQSGHIQNISSATNQHTLIIIFSQIRTQG